ncbi:MAG: BamA/TamA family outer membrane protein [Acidobacteriota bacterium]|jgi:Tol biopolymer transport system component
MNERANERPRVTALRTGTLALITALALAGAAPAWAQGNPQGSQVDESESAQKTGTILSADDARNRGGTARGIQMQIRQTGYGTSYGKNKVAYNDFDFWVYRAPHFDIMYYQEEEAFLDDVVAFSENAYQNLRRLLNHDLSQRTPIIYYQTHAEFEQNHIFPYFLPEAVAAFAEPTVNRLVLPVDDPPDELYKLLTHEITHIFEYDFFYGGEVGRNLRLAPPTWVMEGLAEHVADNLTSLDEMMLRDVVLADQIPTLTQMSYNSGFFVDYVLGQVVFDYITEQYGEDGVRIFMSEIRRDLGQDIDRDLERAFNISPSEFNDNFRTYLRDRYLPNVLEDDEADDFAIGLFHHLPPEDRPSAFSPAVSPEGDEFVAVSVDRKQLKLDIMRFDMDTGEVLKNLTGGGSGYEYIIAQGVTVGYQSGADLSWSPDGTQVAFFGRTPPTRTLFVIDSQNGNTIWSKKLDDLDQAMSPDIGPDGRVAFAAHLNGVRDIWIYDPATDQTLNVTQDEVYDYAPVWSPDGRTLVFTSHVLGYKKLFMVDLARPQQRIQLTFGQSNDTQPAFSRDGTRIFFSSDRTGKYNLYSMALATGEVERLTDILGGVFFPQPVPENVGHKGDLLFTNYADGRYELYLMDIPQAPLETYMAEDEALPDEEVAALEQEMADLSTVQLDNSNISQTPSGGWHISNVNVAGGYGRYGGSGAVLAALSIEVSDLLGNHRIVGVFGSVSNQRNLQGLYFNQKNRLNWGFSGTSQRLFFFTPRIDNDISQLDREAFYELDGAEVFASYPFSRDYRVELSAGYYDQLYVFNNALIDTGGDVVLGSIYPSGSYIPLGISLIADKARFREFGPFAGWRTRVDFTYAVPYGADLQFREWVIDHRMYFPVTARNIIAWRTWLAWSQGNDPNVFFMGGLNQLRGFDWLQFSGNRAWFMNLEYRWPFIDEVRGGTFAITDIRGLFFFDLGGSWFDPNNFTFWKDGRLQDAVASFGGGVMIDLGPMPLNFYLSQRTDLQQLYGGVRFDFYIGPRF